MPTWGCLSLEDTALGHLDTEIETETHTKVSFHFAPGLGGAMLCDAVRIAEGVRTRIVKWRLWILCPEVPHEKPRMVNGGLARQAN